MEQLRASTSRERAWSLSAFLFGEEGKGAVLAPPQNSACPAKVRRYVLLARRMVNGTAEASIFSDARVGVKVMGDPCAEV